LSCYLEAVQSLTEANCGYLRWRVEGHGPA